MIAQISQVATKYMSIKHLVNAFEYVNASKTAEKVLKTRAGTLTDS